RNFCTKKAHRYDAPKLLPAVCSTAADKTLFLHKGFVIGFFKPSYSVVTVCHPCIFFHKKIPPSTEYVTLHSITPAPEKCKLQFIGCGQHLPAKFTGQSSAKVTVVDVTLLFLSIY
ncbi:MAG: hypothetical protein K2G28_06830, partial [Acetatifactor sp.]|nr:hypothetical protein [Acetatifactor sp.]